MKFLPAIAFVLLTYSSVVAQQYTPATVPNVKLINNSYVSNPDHIIADSTVAQLDSMLKYTEEQATAQVAVVLVKSIGDQVVFDFAQELFNLWGIGRSNSNGLLILFVEDQREIRFHTGDGLEGILPDVVCKQIQRISMVPYFKEGKFDEGMIHGVATTAKLLTDPNYKLEITDTATAETQDEPLDYTSFAIGWAIFFIPIFLIVLYVKNGKFADSKPSDATDYPQMRLKRVWWMIEFGGIPTLIVVLFAFSSDPNFAGTAIWTIYFYYAATVLHRMWRERRMIKRLAEKDKYFLITEYFRHSQGYWIYISLIFPFPFILTAPLHFIQKKRWRNHPRKCKQCGNSMYKLSETEDDEYLSQSQQVEEKIASVDYDVWKCKNCGATEQWFFLNPHTKYEVCPHCSAVAWYVESTKTLQSATYSSSGKGEEIRKCKACNKTKRTTYSIAQLTRSSSSSSSSSSSGSSWSSGSSGGSWGGGHSSGGGASSKW